MNKNKISYYHNGFSLLELMVVCLLVAIMGTLAVPTFLTPLRKAKQLDAQFALINAALAMERYYIEHQTYDGITFSLLNLSQWSEQGYYRIEISELGPNRYQLSAVAQEDSFQQHPCSTLTLDQNFTKGPEPACWNERY